MTGKTFFTAEKGFIPFPEPETVFTQNARQCAQQFIPLASVDLSQFFAQLSGPLHFVFPTSIMVDEQNEQIHQHAHDSYSKHEYWVSYPVIDGRYQLPYPLQDDFSINHPRFTKHREALAARRVHFAKHGCLHHPWAKLDEQGHYDKDDRVELIHQLAGDSFAGNWSSCTTFPLKDMGVVLDDDGDEMSVDVPLSDDGRPFIFIGRLITYHYFFETPKDAALIDGEIMLFYDPVSQTALSSFEF
ncbi:hypothetical protein [Celerinatantimonas sp. MCCC 1A17872]|uniref:hypothetical protein n=1 Tax=Celerinatantimonas sp. MCCC 1A17872 TaxID=3177514 RepID=UPI0038C57B60